jgi:hypothetical protein
MTTGGGELATIFPLFAIGYAMGYYFYIRHSLWVLLIGLSFGLVGYASGKRAIYIVIPPFILVCYGVFFLQNKNLPANLVRRFLRHFLICLVVAVPVWVYGVDNSSGIKAEDPELGFRDKVWNAFQFAKEHEQAQLADGRTFARTNTSIHVLNTLVSSNLWHIVYGYGPNSFTEKSGEQEEGAYGFRSLGIGYGITGWSMDTIAIGLPGMILFLAAYGLAFRDVITIANMKARARHWKAIHFGTLLGFLVLFWTYFFYSRIVITVNPITLTLLFYAGLLSSPTNCLPCGALQLRTVYP